ncbi:Fas apoptotic inhibitory molecule (FAIM1) [Natronincola peptidivorans]|uniref:Fas apoptotic inhibitory molecule (FAIM1) n=1 Tax=Natronincola peptidivorans TaxID=426128 RepID=A0A1I0EHJ2_9FIRM|nr:hypothetical protein [Natronincola peptidivorans]SET44804.1 Fas apoptotic inhibitory molecule (FAIM1) [Natronincola peptidivorans]
MKRHWNWNITIERRNYRIDLEYNIGLIRHMKIYVNGHLVKPTKINKGEEGADYFFSIYNHECCIYSRIIGEDLQYSVTLGKTDLITGEEVEYVKVPPKEEEVEVKMTKKEMAVRAVSFIVSVGPIVVVLNPMIEGLLRMLNWEPNEAIRGVIEGVSMTAMYMITADYIVKKLKGRGLLEEAGSSH